MSRKITATLELVLDQFKKNAEAAQKELRKFGRNMDKIGSELSTKVSLPIIAAGAAALKFSIDFNKSMANVATLIPGNIGRVEELKKSIQDLAIDTGKSTEDLANGAYQVVSAYGDSAETIGLLRLAAESAAAGVATTTDSINLLSAVTKGYGDVSLESNRQVSDLAFTAVKLGQTTFPELAASIGRVVPLSAELGVSQEELFAVMATGTGVTGGAAEVSTQLRGVLQSLMAPTKDMSELLEGLGVSSGKALLEQRGLSGTIETIVSAAEKSGIPLQKYMSSIEGQTLALALAGAQSETYEQKLQAMATAQGATAEAYQEQTSGINSFGHALAQLQQVGVVALQRIGDKIIEIFGADIQNLITSLSDKLTGLLDWFDSLDPSVQKFTLSFLGVSAAIGPVLIGIGAVATILGGPLIGAVGAAASAVSLLTAAWVAWGDDITAAVEKGVEYFKNGAVIIKQALSDLWQSFLDFFQKVLDGAALAYGWMPGLGKSVRDLAAEFRVWNEAIEETHELLAQEPGAVSQIYISLSQHVSKLADSAKQAAQEFFTFDQQAKATGEALGGGGAGGGGVAKKTDEAKKAFEGLIQKVRETERALKEVEIQAAIDQAITTGSPEALNKWRKALAEHTREGLVDAYKDSGGKVSAASEALIDRILEVEQRKRQQAAQEDLRDRLETIQKGLADSRISDGINKAIKTGSVEALETWLLELRQATTEGLVKGFQDAGAEITPEAQKLIDEIAQYEYLARREVEIDKLSAERKSAHQEDVAFWAGLMEDAITGTRFDFEEQMKKAAVEVASEFLARMVQGNNSIADSLSGALDSVFGGGNGGFGDLFGSLFGGGNTTSGVGPVIDGAEYANSIGDAASGASSAGSVGGAASQGGGAMMTSAGVLAAAMFGMWVAQTNYERLDETYSSGDVTDEQKAFDAITAAIDTFMPGIGTAINFALGGLFSGSKLSGNEKALVGVERWLQDRLEAALAAGTNSLLGPNGEPTVDIKVREFFDHFNQPGWSDNFWGEFGDKGGDVFNAIGHGLAELLGVSEDVAGQMAYVLAQNLGVGDYADNLDNIKLFLDSIGVSAEQLTQVMWEQAKMGEMTWLQFEQFKNSLASIPEEGLAAAGAYSKAMKLVEDSQGKGMNALKGLQYAAIEASEAGITSLGDLKNALISSGHDVDNMTILFEKLGLRGINSIEDLGSASEETLAGVIADIDAAGFAWGEHEEAVDDNNSLMSDLDTTVGNLSESIKKLAEAIEALPSNKTITITEKWIQKGGPSDRSSSGIDSRLIEAAGRQSLDTPAANYFGSNVVPLESRRTTSQGHQGTNITYNINVTGDNPAMVGMFTDAMKQLHESTVKKSMREMTRMRVRGSL